MLQLTFPLLMVVRIGSDSEASRKLYYRMRNRITGFESMSLKGNIC
jgi:hypothetical protein